MSFFGKLFGGNATKSATGSFRTSAEADPELGPVVAAAHALDGRPAQALFAAARGNWDMRSAVVDVAAEHYIAKFAAPSRAAMVDSLVGSGDVFWRLVRARWHINTGWDARGSGDAETVGADAANVLHQRCAAAESDLRAAAQADPADPTAFPLLMIAAMGLSRRPLAEEAYAAAIARAPSAYASHARMLVIVSKRWFGSHDEMLGLARRVAQSAQPANDIAALPIAAHFDVFSHTNVIDKNPSAAVTQLSAALPEVADACARSVDAAGYRATPSTLIIRHHAAALFWFGGDRAACRAQLAQVGDVLHKSAWNQTGSNATPMYESVRRELGLS